MKDTTVESEIKTGQRFEFGENWRLWLDTLSEERIAAAKARMIEMVGANTIAGKRVLDIGCGSGVHSLAALQLGAAEIISFDFDPASVACTEEIKRRYAPDAQNWKVIRGSALDQEFLKSLGTFDLVYSWGVLHHTGKMWEAVSNAANAVAPSGILFIALYNDQGRWSKIWLVVKQFYNRSPKFLRPVIAAFVLVHSWLIKWIEDLVHGDPARSWREYRKNRGMDPWRDAVDWAGGLPFEVAKPEEVFHAVGAKGLTLINLKTCGAGYGCNEYVFKRSAN